MLDSAGVDYRAMAARVDEDAVKAAMRGGGAGPACDRRCVG